MPPRKASRLAGDLALATLTLAQVALGARTLLRMLVTAQGACVEETAAAPLTDARVCVIVPTLNEYARLGPCLEGLLRQGPEVSEILVVDGGSVDKTQALVATYCARDARVRLVDASPTPPAWNGKAWGLQRGWEEIASHTDWILTLDADVRPAPLLVRSLLAHATQCDVAALSIATRQRLGTAADGLLHPAFLTTLVYRFGLPGHATSQASAVQANGQCFLLQRDILASLDGFAGVRDSLCEDVTLARQLAHSGIAVGFYEAGHLASVKMYDNWRETWSGWARSLPMRDRYSGASGWIGLAEVLLAQALPLPLLVLLALSGKRHSWLFATNLALALARMGALFGTARAYAAAPWSYWLSPLADLPVALQLWCSAFRRTHIWRGRPVRRSVVSPGATPPVAAGRIP